MALRGGAELYLKFGDVVVGADRNLAAMDVDDGFNDGQSQSCPLFALLA